MAAVEMDYIEIYFASLPGWFIAAAIYLTLSKVMQRQRQTQVA